MEGVFNESVKAQGIYSMHNLIFLGVRWILHVRVYVRGQQSLVDGDSITLSDHKSGLSLIIM